MKESLRELTMAQFINMICGDFKVLLEGHEIVSSRKLALKVRDIALEYRAIASPEGSDSYFRHIENNLKLRIAMSFFALCNALAATERFDEVRTILESYGIHTEGYSEARIAGIVQMKLAKARREIEEAEVEDEQAGIETDKIRSHFDELTASLMAHFKFQIDLGTIKASVFAHLVSRHIREVKARIKAMKKR